MSLSVAAFWLCCALGGLAFPPAPEVPRVLVDAPIAARIAANDIPHWKAVGAAGFLFQGIYDTLDAAPQGGVQDLGPTAPESALLKEIRLSVVELNAAGIDQNFLRVGLGPDAAWFSERDDARRGVELFRAAGIFCARAGLRGLALDLRPAAAFYNFGWSGYGATPPSSTQLSEAAREFGRRGLRAFIREMPDADFIFLADGLADAGPLCRDLLEGLVESVGAAESIRLDLALEVGTRASKPNEVFDELAAREERLCGALGAEARRIWQRQGGYAPVLSPFAVQDAAVVAAQPVAEFRAALAAARLAASDFAIVRAPYGAWWKLSAKQASGYNQLRQRGAARATATPRAVQDAAAWDFRAPFDALTRVGPLRERKGAPYVFMDDLRSAVLFWEAPDEPLALDTGVTALLRTSIATRDEATLPAVDGKAPLDKLGAPALVRGLPLGPWAATAALWCAFDAVPMAGAGRVPVRLGLRNVYPGKLEGAIRIETTAGTALGLKELPILLEPGQNTQFERGLQGSFTLGEPLRIGLRLDSPLSPGIARSFPATTHLAASASLQRDGAVSQPPLLATDAAGQVLIVASEAGDLAGYTLAPGQPPALAWQRRLPPPVLLCDAPGRAADGRAVIAVADARGELRAMTARGDLLWQKSLGGRVLALQWAPVFTTENDELLARVEPNTLLCLSREGREEWRHAEKDAAFFGVDVLPHTANTPAPYAARLYVARPATSALLRLGPNGLPMWTRPLAATPMLPPIVLPGSGTNDRVAVPLADGHIAVMGADAGDAPTLSPTVLPEKCTRFEVLRPGLDGSAASVVAVCDGKLLLFDAALAPTGQSEVTRPRTFTTVEDLHGVRLFALDSAGRISAWSATGKLLWRDAPPLGLRALSATSLSAEGSAPARLIAGAADGQVHQIALPE